MEEIQLVMTRKSRNVLIVKSWINLLENARNPKESREPGAEEAKQLKEGHECGRSFSQSILDQMIGNQLVGNNKKGLGYNIVPSPLTGLFVPPCVDLSSSGIEKFKEPKFKGYCIMVLESLNVQKPKQADQPKKNVTILEDAFKKTQTLTLFDKQSQKIGKQAQALQQKRFDIQRICQTGDDSKAKDYEVCKITRADGTSSFLGDFQALLGRLDKQDLFQLYSLVQERKKTNGLNQTLLGVAEVETT
ncbi:hypothetical protein Tco_0150705 [Tanacetum coccineum]